MQGLLRQRGGNVALVGLLFLFLSTTLQPVAAQAPPLPPPPTGGPTGEEYLQLNIGPMNDQGYVFVRPGQQARVMLEVVDNSADRAQDAKNPFPHTIELSARIAGKPAGWSATITNNTIFSAPGSSYMATLIVTALYAAEINYVRVEINGTLTSSDGRRVTDDATVTAQLLPFYAGRAFVQYEEGPVTASQEELVVYPVVIENQATYPDWFTIHLNATPGWRASMPERVYVPPLSSRVVNLTIYTPRTAFYEWGTLGIVSIEIRSQSDPGFRYTTAALVNLKGFHVPGYWIPVALFAVVAAGALVDKSIEKRREAVAREGRPRRPQPTPRQAVLLKELKKRDPAAYKEKMAALAAVWKARREAYRSQVKQRRAEERRLAREQRAAARAEKKRRKQQRKLDAQREAALEKERHARLKDLAAKQAVVDKLRRKEEKKQAKLDRQRKKELAKVAKAKGKELEKARKAAAKQQAAAERAARKAAKGRAPPPPEGPEGNG